MRGLPPPLPFLVLAHTRRNRGRCPEMFFDSGQHQTAEKRVGVKCLRFSSRIWEARKAHRRSLHSAPPDFLWNLLALMHFMRVSLTETRTRYPVQCCVAGNPGTLRSG